MGKPMPTNQKTEMHAKAPARQRAAWILYFILQTAILITFKAWDLSGAWDMADRLKYGSIILNTLVLLFLWRKRPFDFIALGLLITLVADTFLIGLDTAYGLGVFCFCLVQTCYCLKMQNRRLFLRGVLILVIWTVLFLFKQKDPVVYLSAFSILMLTGNTVEAFVEKDLLFGIGLVLFTLCDLSVGLQNALVYVPAFPFPALVKAASELIWIFYLPSQVILLYRWFREYKDIRQAQQTKRA